MVVRGFVSIPYKEVEELEKKGIEMDFYDYNDIGIGTYDSFIVHEKLEKWFNDRYEILSGDPITPKRLILNKKDKK